MIDAVVHRHIKKPQWTMLSAPFYHSLITKSSCHSKSPMFKRVYLASDWLWPVDTQLLAAHIKSL